MGKLQLIYFNATARAEPARFMLHYKGVDFDDKRIEEEEWPKLKPSTPFGQLPVLDVDGVKICQSGAINRYIANKYGLAGDNEMDQVRADMAYGCVDDIYSIMMPMFLEKDMEKRPAIIAQLKEGRFKDWMENLNKLLGDKNFFLGDKPTYADFSLATHCALMFKIGAGDLLEKYPKLIEHQKRVESLPGVKEYIAKRPVTKF